MRMIELWLIGAALGACSLARSESPDEPSSGKSGSGGVSAVAGAPGGGLGSGGDAASAGADGSQAAGGSAPSGEGGSGDSETSGGASGDSGDGPGGAGHPGGGGGGMTSGTGGGGVAGGGTGSGGAAGVSAGASGAGGGDSELDTPIQQIRMGAVPEFEQAFVGGVLVTALRVSSGNLNVTVQEPSGVTVSGTTYPAYAGLTFFVASSLVPTFPNLDSVDVGACVSVRGTVTDYEGRTQLNPITRFSVLPEGECGQFPEPLTLPLAEIATDVDPSEPGDQAGAFAESYEDVLVKVNMVEGLTSNAREGDPFRVTPAGGTAEHELLIESYYFRTLPIVTAGQVFQSITGVLYQFVNYRLGPRTAADLSY
jgi:hypothetical protein